MHCASAAAAGGRAPRWLSAAAADAPVDVRKFGLVLPLPAVLSYQRTCFLDADGYPGSSGSTPARPGQGCSAGLDQAIPVPPPATPHTAASWSLLAEHAAGLEAEQAVRSLMAQFMPPELREGMAGVQRSLHNVLLSCQQVGGLDAEAQRSLEELGRLTLEMSSYTEVMEEAEVRFHAARQGMAGATRGPGNEGLTAAHLQCVTRTGTLAAHAVVT